MTMIEEKAKAAVEKLKEYAVYTFDDFMEAEFVQLGIIDEQFEDSILGHFHEELEEDLKSKTGTEELYLTLNKHFFSYYYAIKSMADKFVLEGKNYLDFIIKSYEEKFFVDFENLDEWLKELEIQFDGSEEDDVASIPHAPTERTFDGRNMLSEVFDYIDKCSPEIPRVYCNCDKEIIMISFSIKKAENHIYTPDFEKSKLFCRMPDGEVLTANAVWKYFLEEFFGVPDSAWRKEGFDSLVFVYSPQQTPKIIFNGKDYGLLYKPWFYDFKKYYELRIHHVFYIITNSTILEWVRELEEEWCCEIFSGRRCRLERLHRLMVTDTWKGWTDKKYNEGVTRSIKDRLLGFK